MKDRQRKALFVGARVQKVLAARAALHWVLCLVVVFLSIFIGGLLTEPDYGMAGNWSRTWTTMGPPLVVSLCFIPCVILDNLRLSNRFSGPIARMRSQLAKLHEGASVRPLEFRNDDFFTDLGEEINSLAISINLADPEITGESSGTITRKDDERLVNA